MSPDPHKKKPLGLDMSRTPTFDSPPGIAALFVIRFDIKTGYVVSWKRSAPGVEVEGVVEYKSLPSGLHNVTDDLVYFVHEEYAGISAFVNLPAGEAERNAKMFAIGVLVPLSLGRLGKGWRHAPRLMELAQGYAKDMSNIKPISDYWETHQIRGNDASILSPDSPLESPIGLRFKPHNEQLDGLHRNRTFSDAMVMESSRLALTPSHPASSLPAFLDSFGPLIFPLYRAALLRKRILLMAEAPVHTPCDYVYDLSLLASLPNSILPLLPSDGLPNPRPRPLFNVGVHDIPYLSSFVGATPSSEQDSAWIACTTDSVLSMKPELYDVQVTLPPPYSKDAPEKVYPKISFLPPSAAKPNPAQAVQLKATQRDVRRYCLLRKGLRQMSEEQESEDQGDEDSDAESTYSSSPVVEPLSWSRLAYTSFMWWASAGEKRGGLSEEEEDHQVEQDIRLLASVETLANNTSGSMQPEETAKQPPEIALVAYFRRLTTQIFVTLSDVVARHDNEDPSDPETDNQNGTSNNVPYEDEPEDYSEPITQQSTRDEPDAPLLPQGKVASTDQPPPDEVPITITIEDMMEMGLDIWSATDRVFVEEMVRLWWGRAAHVDGARVRCCGISIL
ncbi:hypothetical protein MW887_009650 [Aspergillus wentii]|nr:hypothetical protein MW887_009650 [Aspergillus wentii]